ncbi:unnamed protein product [Notodromas monacha]|uniref:Methyltransferase type 11 domain-containing protein n=1 Tax=Notodromas monacha TaxID=399045 RepID=A0A7R9BP82_9CRUS|nr:unnamed protein product [Notodromas monacha]CAG0919154.1 unnamed protein product [Notodromas monacha]
MAPAAAASASALIDPNLFLSASSKVMGDVAVVMDEFGLHFKIRPHDRVLFLNSRVGNYAKSFIAPLLPSEAEMIGVEMNPTMVDYARKNFGGPNVGFIHLAPDRLGDLKEMYPSGFSHIVSFLSLQWIREYKTVLGQLQPLLREGGVLFCSLFENAPQFDIFESLRSDPVIGPVVKNPPVAMGLFVGKSDSVKIFTNDLKEAGFKPEVVQSLLRLLLFPTINSLDRFPRAMNPFQGFVPENVNEKIR